MKTNNLIPTYGNGFPCETRMFIAVALTFRSSLTTVTLALDVWGRYFSPKKSGVFNQHKLDSIDTGTPFDAKSAGLSFEYTHLQLRCYLICWMQLATKTWNFLALLFTSLSTIWESVQNYSFSLLYFSSSTSLLLVVLL